MGSCTAGAGGSALALGPFAAESITGGTAPVTAVEGEAGPSGAGVGATDDTDVAVGPGVTICGVSVDALGAGVRLSGVVCAGACGSVSGTVVAAILLGVGAVGSKVDTLVHTCQRYLQL